MLLFSFGSSLTQSVTPTPTRFNFDVPLTNTPNRIRIFKNFPTKLLKTESDGSCFGIPTITLVHLAGFDVITPTPTLGKTSNASVRNTNISDNIVKSIKEFRARIGARKTIPHEVTGKSNRECNDIKLKPNGIRNFQCTLQGINTNHMKVLRKEIALMVQSMQDKSMGFPQENFPIKLFEDKIIKYAQDLSIFRKQIEHTENIVRFIIESQNISHKDIKRGFKEINKSLKISTGRLRLMHRNIDTLKAEYLSLQKNLHFDSQNIFGHLNEAKSKTETHETVDPNSFSNTFAIFGDLSSP